MISSRLSLNDYRIQAFVLFAYVFLLYLPAITAEISLVDDKPMLEHFAQKQSWSFREYFLPGHADGLYYRPLLVLSQISDRFLFQLNPVVMHTENILLHALNTLLVFLFARTLCTNNTDTYAPFFAALFFGCHPLATESVNWISGRTDLLAGLFVLLSIVGLMQYRKYKQFVMLVSSAIAFLCAVLTKEVSLAVLPGLLLMLSAPESADSRTYNRKHMLIVSASTMLAAFALFAVLRGGAFASTSSRIGLTLQVISNDLWHSLFVCLRAFGFYLKKIVIPQPLNFAILEVDPLYELLGIPLLLACIWIATRRTLLAASFTAGILLLTPSFLIAFGQIAWTPYAERYLYIPLMFILPSGVLYLQRNLLFPNGTIKLILCVGVIVFFMATTFQRNIVWQTNETLVAETLRESPRAAKLWYVQAGIYEAYGEMDKAIAAARTASSLTGIPYDERHDLLLARLLAKMGKKDDAIVVYHYVLKRSAGKSEEAKKQLNTLELTEGQGNTTQKREQARP